MLTVTDLFCGAGGSSIGLAGAGMELKLAANHWERAIDTHSANFLDAEHLCQDINNYDMRRLPRTDVLWASPICTEVSPAGGRRRGGKRLPGQVDMLEEYGYIAKEGYDRTRATFHDVIRATEVHRYAAVLVENVVDVATVWELFDWWVDGMKLLDYSAQFVSVSSAHIGGEDNPYAPQWRDRLYIVFTRKGIPLPDVDPHPLALCVECGEDVAAVQSWKNPRARRIGKHRQQYVYVCPNAKCGHSVVEPYVLPAAAAIDWSDLGTRIGDRKRPLAANTIRRIKAGLEMFAQPITVAAAGNTWERPGSGYVRAWPAHDAPLVARTGTAGDGLASPPLVVNTNHDDDRLYPADAAPLAARTVKIGEGVATPPMLVPTGGTWNETGYPADLPMRTRMAREMEGVCTPPFITMLRENATATGMEDPLATITTGRNHGLTVPPFVAMLRGNANPRGVGEPLNAVMTGRNHALVVPYYRTGRAKSTAVPLDTLCTKDRFALVSGDMPDPEDCYFRMLQPREHLRAQRFPDSYIVRGNKGEQTMQAGNAVSANVAHWLAQRVVAAMGGGDHG